MATTMRRTNRTASPERWQAALGRAIAEGVQVRQIASTGQWVATSGTQSGVCYLLDVTAGVVDGCTCPAGEFGDPCCKHAAGFYHAAGLLDPDPEPEPTAPEPAPDPSCRSCFGEGWEPMYVGGGLSDYWPMPCRCLRRKEAAAIAA